MDDMHVGAMDMEERARKTLAAVGDPSRFRLVSALLTRPHSVGEAASVVGLSQSCTTRHLQVLQREGLVTRVRQGKRVVFSLREESGMASLIRRALAVSGAAGAAEDRVEAPAGDGGPARSTRRPIDPEPVAGPKPVGEESATAARSDPGDRGHGLGPDDAPGQNDHENPVDDLEDFLL